MPLIGQVFGGFESLSHPLTLTLCVCNRAQRLRDTAQKRLSVSRQQSSRRETLCVQRDAGGGCDAGIHTGPLSEAIWTGHQHFSQMGSDNMLHRGREIFCHSSAPSPSGLAYCPPSSSSF